MGCLIYYHCPCFVLKLLKYPLPLLLVIREKCLKGKSSRLLPGYYKCCDTRTGSRHRSNRDPRLKALSHQLFSGIRYTRCSGVCYDRNILPGKQLLHQICRFVIFVELMVAGHWCLYLKMIKKLYAVSGILRSYQVCFIKYPYCPIGHVLKISDWRSNQIKCSTHSSNSPYLSISCLHS